MKRSLQIVPLLCLALYVSCDFQNPADFQAPKWKINLTIPLLDGEYGIAGIVDDSTIHSSGDSLLIKFDGILPIIINIEKISLGDDVFDSLEVFTE